MGGGLKNRFFSASISLGTENESKFIIFAQAGGLKN